MVLHHILFLVELDISMYNKNCLFLYFCFFCFCEFVRDVSINLFRPEPRNQKRPPERSVPFFFEVKAEGELFVCSRC